MRTTRLAHLTDAMQKKRLIRFGNPFDSDTITAYVQAIGPQFFLAAIVNDDIWLNGFACFRITDIRKLSPEPYADFIEQALKKRRQKIPAIPHIDLSNISALLTSANQAYPLITIYQERLDPDICQIGRIVDMHRSHVSLLRIRPGAVWDDTADCYKLRDITRLAFGGDYEDALYLVAKKLTASHIASLYQATQ
ncbi:MAG: hypothetical protein IT497_09425 [Ottowia sp.]|nr:hypothetical protein [Ottowia sp.]